MWLAAERDAAAELSWRAGDGRWRHIGRAAAAGAEIVAPTAEDGYLVLSGAAGADGAAAGAAQPGRGHARHRGGRR